MIYKKIEIVVDGYKETADLYTYFLDNSIEMHINRKRPVEMLFYPVGGHGLSLANEETSYEDGRCIQKECQTWMEPACKWIENIK